MEQACNRRAYTPGNKDKEVNGMALNTESRKTLALSNIRNVNVINIMQAVLKGKSKTRSELSKENNISLMTVKHIADDLIESGILQEKTTAGGEVGRKPKALELSKSYGNIVCVNLTFTDEITFLIYDIYETLLYEQTLPRDTVINYRENLMQVIGSIKKALSSIEMQMIGIAVFVPSAFYEDRDLVNYDLITDFKDLHLKQIFTEAFALQNVLVLHDVIPAAWSEYESTCKTEDSQFYFYCGHGVGGFFIHQGTAVMGEELMAGEVGKMLLTDRNGERQCVTLEEVISVSAINRKLSEQGVGIKFKDLLKQETSQWGKAKELIDEAVDTIARTLYNLLWVYNPTVIVIDSCYRAYSSLIARRFERFLQEVSSAAIPISVIVKEAQFNEYHNMRGCFHMVRDAWVISLTDS